MKFHSLLILLLAIGQTQAIWPFDSNDSESSSSTSTSSGSGGFWPFGSDDSSTSTSESRSETDSPSSSSSSSSTGDSTSTDSSWYQIFLDSGGDENNDGLNKYCPYNTTCPNHSIIREAIEISDNEKEYLQNRHKITNKNLIDFLLKNPIFLILMLSHL